MGPPSQSALQKYSTYIQTYVQERKTHAPTGDGGTGRFIQSLFLFSATAAARRRHRRRSVHNRLQWVSEKGLLSFSAVVPCGLPPPPPFGTAARGARGHWLPPARVCQTPALGARAHRCSWLTNARMERHDSQRALPIVVERLLLWSLRKEPSQGQARGVVCQHLRALTCSGARDSRLCVHGSVSKVRTRVEYFYTGMYKSGRGPRRRETVTRQEPTARKYGHHPHAEKPCREEPATAPPRPQSPAFLANHPPAWQRGHPRRGGGGKPQSDGHPHCHKRPPLRLLPRRPWGGGGGAPSRATPATFTTASATPAAAAAASATAAAPRAGSPSPPRSQCQRRRRWRWSW